MANYLLGENVNLGVGKETTRGTPVAPAAWIPARAPAGINVVVEKTAIKETRGTRFSSSGQEVTHKRAEGELEFNVRNKTIGYILKSLLGNVNSTAKVGDATVYEHTFSVLSSNPSNPSLTLALSQPGFTDYEYKLALVSALELSTPMDDLVNATASFLAAGEAEKTPSYTPAFSDDDHYFRNHDIRVKIASDVAGLSSADAICIKDFKMKIANNAKPQMCVASISPIDILGMTYEIEGTLTVDYTGKDNHDKYVNATVFAMEISMINTSKTIGTASNPEIKITLPNVTIKDYKANRPIDDIVTEELGISCHYSLEDNSAITVKVVNELATY
jgi:hypothetical protein